MNPKILLVEDDADFGMILKQYLELSDFEVIWFQNPEDVLEIIETQFDFQIGILDVMMPNIDGFSLAKHLLKKQANFPILFLTAKNQKIDRLTGLKLGADDYISKPCDPEELVLRIQNILKRSTFTAIQQTEIKIGSYLLNTEKLQLEHPKGKHKLTLKENELLLFLLNHNHQLLKREVILENLWENTDYFSGRSLDVFISRLRKYFADDDSIKIMSIRGVGFELDFPE
ncbi:DNA-binding response regulator, OmpR family, contains REC and winged-helix (wHTH) domain [Soonwooa buanensis]|uniref:DNA-binding response regulator, OmpR family, contains REC and winged-helix (WHTH) domain n=1 Tax=Soonwooa buanensis TaxID=619805 RepID=A0A1T5GM12_9FLAO|nr:response regulator transcription factor [Soonwooa buanensis]SKC09449.1 DNA-binding response regulator, OmpR family, contains REC and winged-helix (wHTH) domain [Soonwooa buanensis]